MRKYFVNLLKNPIAVGAAAMLIAVLLIVTSESKLLVAYPFWSHVVEKIAEAIFVSGAFATIFDFFSKNSLIDESVRRAIGQSKSMFLGIRDLETQASKIKYGEAFLQSSILIMSSRFSDRILNNHKDDIISRLKAGKDLSFIVMEECELSRLMPGYDDRRRSPKDFFEGILKNRLIHASQVSMYSHPNPFCYNFVKIDSGVWIKLYWNSSKDESPPAIFFEVGSPLYNRFDADINGLINQAKKIVL